MMHNVGAYAVAGLGGLENEAKRNVKPDQLRAIHEPKSYQVPRIHRTLNHTDGSALVCALACTALA